MFDSSEVLLSQTYSEVSQLRPTYFKRMWCGCGSVPEETGWFWLVQETLDGDGLPLRWTSALPPLELIGLASILA